LWWLLVHLQLLQLWAALVQLAGLSAQPLRFCA
jgi:hypothetical protein